VRIKDVNFIGFFVDDTRLLDRQEQSVCLGFKTLKKSQLQIQRYKGNDRIGDSVVPL
jgi:hypothetical protein